jgi:hypothetical protein
MEWMFDIILYRKCIEIVFIFKKLFFDINNSKQYKYNK